MSRRLPNGSANGTVGAKGKPPNIQSPATLSPLKDLRQITTALRIEAAALERELGASPDRPTVAAVNKLQAVVGEIEIAGIIARRLVDDVRQYLKEPGVDSLTSEERLSTREREVLRMLAHGWTVSQIATRLALNVKTVSTYRVRVLRKFGFATTAQLIRYGIRHHLDN